MKSKLLTLSLAFALAGSVRADFNPVQLTTNSYTFDIVVEKTAPLPEVGKNLTTATLDTGLNAAGNTFYEIGFNVANPTTGIPHPGAIFTATGTNAGHLNHQFQTAPSYKTNNAVFLSTQLTTGAIQPVTPANYQALSFLDSAGSGPVPLNYVISFADGTTQTGTFSVLDWFNQTTFVAFTAKGRTDANTFALNNVNQANAVQFYYNDVVLSNTVSAVTNVAFTYVSGGRAAILGVSGSTDGVNFSPMGITGYDQDIIVEGPGNLAGFTTASMDNGTNNTANTWYEKGWENLAPTTGLPSAGSTIASLQATNRFYTMAPSYSAPNAILIDTNHQTANITPKNPTNYTAFSLLTAGGSIGSSVMTNYCIMQHADGTSETNVFLGYDWFNSTVPPAFIANGRLSLNNRQPNTVNGGNPKLFESQFGLVNTTSPVTNILLKFFQAPGVSATTYVLAVSATAGAVGPVISSQPLPANVYVNNTAQFSVVTSAGTPPISYVWQVGTNGVFVNLANGATGSGSTISGANTSTLTIANVGPSDVATYQVVLNNVANTPVTSTAVPLLILSPLADILTPGDANYTFANTVTNANGAAAAFDHTTAGFTINGFNGNVAPFTGPVGIVVTPSLGSTVVSGIRIYPPSGITPQNDPIDYMLEGSNDGGNTWSLLNSNTITLEINRNSATAVPINPTNQFLGQDLFANTNGYASYRISFFDVRTNAASGQMQAAEVELLGVANAVPPIITTQPATPVKRYAGATTILSVTANGVPPLLYQWYVNGTTAISGATNASFSLTNLQVSQSGNNYSCTVSDIYGSTNSASSLLTVLPAPTGTYPTTVLADNPIAFFRLDESPDDGAGNIGTVANDSWGGHDGAYTNVVLGVQGYSTNDADTAAAFGTVNVNPSYVGGIKGLSFATPTNQNATFSLEAWVWDNQGQQFSGAGIITLGYGGAEQYALDCGGNGTANDFRFYFRDALTGASHTAVSTNTTADQKWHHLVGVLDEVHSNQVFYVDGKLVASNALAGNLGVNLVNTIPVTIGARSTSATNAGPNLQFTGTIDEVAVYNYALSAQKVQAHYLAGGIPPVLTQTPTNVTASEGTTATFTGVAYGSATLAYQWYNSDGSNPTTALAGQTSTNLNLSNVGPGQNGSYYQLVVTNAFGSVASPAVSLTVISGPPTIQTDLQSQYAVYVGNPISLSVSAGGTPTLTYQWQYNSANLADGGRITGSHSNVLTVANAQTNDTGVYQLIVSNGQGTQPSTAATVTVLPRVNFNTNGLGWSTSGAQAGSLYLGSNILQLTDGVTASEVSGSFFKYPVYIGGFQASWTYTDVSGGGADGVAFVVQNDARGASALGTAGGSLGVNTITPSVELEFNIYANNTVGYAFHTNGINGGYIVPGSVVLSSGDPINVSLTYLNGVATMSLTDATTTASYTTNTSLNIPAIVGAGTAYVGFTAADGGTLSTQQVSNFTFSSLIGVSAVVSGSNLVITWPLGVGGYVLQSSPSLTPPNWTTVATPAVQANGLNQVTVPVGAANKFYRLSLQ